MKLLEFIIVTLFLRLLQMYLQMHYLLFCILLILGFIMFLTELLVLFHYGNQFLFQFELVATNKSWHFFFFLIQGYESASISSTCEPCKSRNRSAQAEEPIQAKVFSRKNHEQLEKIIKCSRSTEISSGMFVSPFSLLSLLQFKEFEKFY